MHGSQLTATDCSVIVNGNWRNFWQRFESVFVLHGYGKSLKVMTEIQSFSLPCLKFKNIFFTTTELF